MLDCPFCTPAYSGSLVRLPDNHPEYNLSVISYDGTKNWYLCSECGGVFCRDKIMKKWQLSPDTYTQFIKKGLIEDKLEK